MDNVVIRDDTTSLLEDNPCWGSPTQCDLPYFLTQFSRSQIIVWVSPHYVAVNKPPDVRMDGPYPTTLHKLLLFWYPPTSLLKQSSREMLQMISTLHYSNSLQEEQDESSCLRPCHQLDYATSGLILYARSQASAHFAITQWEARQVTKEYLACVELSPSRRGTDSNGANGWQTWMDSLDRFTNEEIKERLTRMETFYKKTRQPSQKRKATFQGYQPVHAMFQKYKGIIVSRSTNIDNQKKKKKKKKLSHKDAISLTEDDWKQVWEPVGSLLKQQQGEQEPELSQIEWKQLSRSYPQWKEAMERSTKIHNDLLRTAIRKQEEEEASGSSEYSSFPMFFTKNENTHETDCEEQVIYISCPLAADPYSFSMKIPPSEANSEDWKQSLVGSTDLDYKPSVTKCTVVEPHHANDSRIQVRLVPLTGRRHQLRVHMALLASEGYGIVGDVTYHQKCHASVSNETRAQERMRLHSHELSLRLLTDDQRGSEMVHLVAPDIF